MSEVDARDGEKRGGEDIDERWPRRERVGSEELVVEGLVFEEEARAFPMLKPIAAPEPIENICVNFSSKASALRDAPAMNTLSQ